MVPTAPEILSCLYMYGVRYLHILNVCHIRSHAWNPLAIRRKIRVFGKKKFKRGRKYQSSTRLNIFSYIVSLTCRNLEYSCNNTFFLHGNSLFFFTGKQPFFNMRIGLFFTWKQHFFFTWKQSFFSLHGNNPLFLQCLRMIFLYHFNVISLTRFRFNGRRDRIFIFRSSSAIEQQLEATFRQVFRLVAIINAVRERKLLAVFATHYSAFVRTRIYLRAARI